MSYHRHLQSIQAQLAIAPGMSRLETLRGDEIGSDMRVAMLDEAARFAEQCLEPLNREMDRVGASLISGRVITAPSHRSVWDQYAIGRRFASCGEYWLLDLPERSAAEAAAIAHGGQRIAGFDAVAGNDT